MSQVTNRFSPTLSSETVFKISPYLKHVAILPCVKDVALFKLIITSVLVFAPSYTCICVLMLRVYACRCRHVRDADDTKRTDASDDHASADAVQLIPTFGSSSSSSSEQ